MAEYDPATDAGISPTNTTTPGDTRTATTRQTHQRNPRCLTGKARIEQAIAEHAARLAADAPPLSPEQRRRIAELFAYQPPR